jgi:hypothetical protein
MKTQPVPFSRKLSQFRLLSRKLNRLMKEGKFQLLSASKQQMLLTRLRELYTSLNGVISTFRLKKALAGAAFLLGIAFSTTTNAQTFEPKETNPFGINTANFSIPSFVDIDDDGDLDMFISQYEATGYKLGFVENVGTPNSPNFEGQTVVDNPFGLETQNLDPEYVVAVAFADMDNDGDQDMIAGGSGAGENGSIVYYENTGTATQPSFGAPVVDPFGFLPTYYIAIPDLVDIDDDGDFDLLVTEYYANTQFYENVGTAENPMFANPVENPFGIQTSGVTGYYSFFDLADIDVDGDLDLLRVGGAYTSVIEYQENIGTASAPNFAAPQANPFNFDQLGLVAMPHMADIDSDGDTDIFFTNAIISGPTYTFEIQYYENTSIINSTNDLLNESTLTFGPNPTVDFISLSSELKVQNEPINLSIINVSGQIIEQHRIQSFGNQINWNASIGHLPSGAYFLRLETDNQYGIIPFEKL